jgi:regulator of sigma D
MGFVRFGFLLTVFVVATNGFASTGREQLASICKSILTLAALVPDSAPAQTRTVTIAEGTFTISATTITHIIKGDITNKILDLTVQDKKIRHAVPVISGGLHTWSALIKLMNARGKYVQENAEVSQWARYRELSNGVTQVRLPKDMFTTKALENTRLAEENLQSGYAWKTLFPNKWSEEEIVQSIEAVITSPKAVSDSKFGNNFEGSYRDVSIKVYTDRNGQVITAFPAWIQKKGEAVFAYHFYKFDSALATFSNVFPHETIPLQALRRWPSAAALIEFTPKIFLDSVAVRKKRLTKRHLKEAAIAQIADYISDPFIHMAPFETAHKLLFSWPNEKRSVRTERALAFNYNILDGIQLLIDFDSAHGTNYAWKTARTVFRNTAIPQVNFDYVDHIQDAFSGQLFNAAAKAATHSSSNSSISEFFQDMLQSVSFGHFVIFNTFDATLKSYEKLLERAKQQPQKRPPLALVKEFHNRVLQTSKDIGDIQFQHEFEKIFQQYFKDVGEVL